MNANDLTVIKAEHASDYTLTVTFSNGVCRQVDFAPFVTTTKAKYLQKYKKIHKFKKFRIEDGNVVWGKDEDLIFPMNQLYHNNINDTAKRGFC